MRLHHSATPERPSCKILRVSVMNPNEMIEESEIRLLDAKTQRAYPTAQGAAIVHASRRLAWRSSLVLEVHRMAAHEYDEHAVVGHQLLFNLGEPVRLGWKEDSRRYEGMLATGAICIQSDGALNAPRWHTPMLFATASIPPSMVAAALLERTPTAGTTFAKRHCIQDPRAHDFITSLVAELSAPTEPLYAEALAHGFLLHLLGTHGQGLHLGRNKKPRGRLHPTHLRNVLELIHTELGGDLSLQRIASSCGYSPFQFARLFKATTGLAPHAFVLRLRLERARERLRSGSASVAEVALAMGFFDQAHFTSVFRRAFGVTPGAFVKEARR